MNSDTTILPWIVSRFESRYGDDRRVWKISSNEYKIVGKSHFMRGGADGKRTLYADFEGGPMVVVGDDLMQYGIVGDNRYVSEIIMGEEKDLMTGEKLSSVTIKVSSIREKVVY